MENLAYSLVIFNDMSEGIGLPYNYYDYDIAMYILRDIFLSYIR